MSEQTLSQQTWYFTFGHGQQFQDGYVRIDGTFESARAEMISHFGTAWCDQYASAERAGVEEFGLTEVPRKWWPQPTDPDRCCRNCGATSGLKMLHSGLGYIHRAWECYDGCAGGVS